MSEFKIGDLCDFDGMRVTVIRVIGTIFEVENKHQHIFKFYSGGYFHPEDQLPSLKLIERPKKKITKRFWLWDIRNALGVRKHDWYMDDEAKDTRGDDSIDKRNLFRKHENEFIDIEVEAEE